jgi:membrane-bound ClpP family serine protease
MKNPRLIIAVITSLLDEVIILAIILFGLPRLGIHIPLYGVVLICTGFLAWAVCLYSISSKTMRKKALLGSTNMVGSEGRVVKRLSPEGFIRIHGELWQAKAEHGKLDIGADVVVVSQDRLKLVVRRKTPA